ncbi:hypothetical protein ACODT5_46900 [Streptomyces sp. 5.8]|uniref:hypothetical protein n=1 Tax=Streptomyces sp. 5.8 TaxID=3406571 RepID=UPI003BB5940C
MSTDPCGETQACVLSADSTTDEADDDVLRCRCGQRIADTAPYGMCGQCIAEEWDDDD